MQTFLIGLNIFKEIGWDHTKQLREQNVSVQPYDEYKRNVSEDCKKYLVSDKLYAEFSKNGKSLYQFQVGK